MEFDDRRKRSKKSKGAKRKTRAMLEAERKGPLTFASLLEEAASSGICPVSCHCHGLNSAKMAANVMPSGRS